MRHTRVSTRSKCYSSSINIVLKYVFYAQFSKSKNTCSLIVWKGQNIWSNYYSLCLNLRDVRCSNAIHCVAQLPRFYSIWLVYTRISCVGLIWQWPSFFSSSFLPTIKDPLFNSESITNRIWPKIRYHFNSQWFEYLTLAKRNGCKRCLYCLYMIICTQTDCQLRIVSNRIANKMDFKRLNWKRPISKQLNFNLYTYITIVHTITL